MTESQTAHQQPKNYFGLPFLALVGLAAIGVPRVVLHDLRVISEGDPLTWVLAILPLVVSIIVTLRARVASPFLTMLAIGTIFGVMLVITHQLLWDFAFEGDLPSLGGPAGVLIPRIAAVFSGLFTGVIMGVVGGLLAWGIQALTKRAR
jgi:hypothetical protein